MLDNTPDVLSLKDLQKLLKIGKNKALELVQGNIIEGHKIGGKWLILKEDVKEYILRS